MNSECGTSSYIWYNTSFNGSIGMSPFQDLNGRPVPDLNRYRTGTSTTGSIDSTLHEHQQL